MSEMPVALHTWDLLSTDTSSITYSCNGSICNKLLHLYNVIQKARLGTKAPANIKRQPFKINS